jgi:hypothetical protein
LRLLREQIIAYDEFNDAFISRLPGDLGLGSQVAEMSKGWLNNAIDAFR